MLDFLTRRVKWLIAAFTILVIVVTQSGWLENAGIWQRLEGTTIDHRFRARGSGIAHPDIKIIGILGSSMVLDSESGLWPEEIAASPALQQMQKPWPWDRSVYSALLEKLVDAGAKVVMFDLVFKSSTEGDEAFAAALKKYQDKVVIGSMFTQASRAAREEEVTYVTPNDALFPDQSAPIIGFVNTWADEDGITRRARVHTTLLKQQGSDFPDSDPGVLSLSGMAVQKFRGKAIAPPGENSNFINFAGTAGKYEVYAIEKCFVDKLWEAPPLNNGEIFKDKIVLVGPYAEILQDFHQTPWGNMPGPEIQANMLASLLDGSFLHAPSANVIRTVTFGMILFAALVCIFMRSALTQGILLAIVGVGFFFIAQQFFSGSNLVIPMVPPLFGLIATGMGGIGLRYLVEQLERKRVRSVLDRYVSKNVAKTILGDRRNFVDKLRGKKQHVTVLFSDIRGFTSMTESTDATQLVTQLNEYFVDMVGIVYKHEGTLQKFIGDAIMAAWGDTHSNGLEVDARKAIQSALDMRAALTKLNQTWEGKNDRTKLSIGIGINHGEVVVGNIGHVDFRMEFTVLGDGVNLAARLESATKQFKTDILIGEEAEKLTRNDFIFRRVGAIAFKGKTKPVEVYFLLGEKFQPTPPWLAEYHQAVSLYRERCFDQAIAHLKAVNEQLGGDDYLCKMYLERCHECVGKSLPEAWDGAFALTEK